MVSWATLTAVPVDVLPRPAFAREFAARLRAASSATTALDEAVDDAGEAVDDDEEAVDDADLSTVVPATACVACVPETAPPEVLMYRFFNVSGFCQNSGATSMTTWYCCGLYGL